MKTESYTSLSRRSLMTVLASFSLLAQKSAAEEANPSDIALINLGRKFASLASQVDYVVDQKLDLSWDVLTQLDDIQEQILKHEAKTTAGLFAKAQTICWGRLGDLDPSEDMNFSEKMALSIIRDLIRLHNPILEQPGALTNLINS